MALTVGVNTYITAAEADSYFEGSINSAPWDSADTVVREKALISATRNIDMNNFIGEKTDPAQDLEWPRAGVTDVDPNTVPIDIKNAQAEMALFLISNPGFAQTQDNSNNISELAAGSAKIKYFNRIESTGNPYIVNQLLLPYLDSQSGTNAIGVPIASGVCDNSTFENDNRNGVTEGI